MAAETSQPETPGGDRAAATPAHSATRRRAQAAAEEEVSTVAQAVGLVVGVLTVEGEEAEVHLPAAAVAPTSSLRFRILNSRSH